MQKITRVQNIKRDLQRHLKENVPLTERNINIINKRTAYHYYLWLENFFLKNGLDNEKFFSNFIL